MHCRGIQHARRVARLARSLFASMPFKLLWFRGLTAQPRCTPPDCRRRSLPRHYADPSFPAFLLRLLRHGKWARVLQVRVGDRWLSFPLPPSMPVSKSSSALHSFLACDRHIATLFQHSGPSCSAPAATFLVLEALEAHQLARAGHADAHLAVDQATVEKTRPLKPQEILDSVCFYA